MDGRVPDARVRYAPGRAPRDAIAVARDAWPAWHRATVTTAGTRDTMLFDPDNPVVQLCAAGMAVDGDADAASALFAQAWDARRDDFDASVAAHFVARHQRTPECTLEWNVRAVEHAEVLTDGRASQLLPSLYLNLGDAYRALGRHAEASSAAQRASDALTQLPPGGYRDFVALGIARLHARLAEPR